MEGFETILTPLSQQDYLPSQSSAPPTTHVRSPLMKSMLSSPRTSPYKNKRPAEESPTKHRTLAPKSLFTKNVEYTPLPKIPKKKAHQSDVKHAVRPIFPKPYIFGSKGSSPTKAAALMLKKKATLVCQRRSPVKILPKNPIVDCLPVPPTFSRVFTRSQGHKDLPPPESETTSNQEQTLAKSVPFNTSNYKGDANKNLENDGGVVIPEKDGRDPERDEDQMQLDDLMAACTTIRYDPKKSSVPIQDNDTKSKSQKRREICLSMLEEDILDTDPKKDERDTEYAKDYFNRVKHALQHDPERFRQFLTVLHEMNKNNGNPVKLYVEISTLLHNHQDLVDDFASFLLAHQAVECGCFVSFLQYQQLREFLRKLEIYCDNATPFQRTLKTLSKWLTQNQEIQPDTATFKERISSTLKNVPNILDELLDYYLDGQLPDSQSEEFEEVNLEATSRVSGFEEVTLPAGKETYNTKLCACECHDNKKDERFKRRTRHCFSCSLKVDNGLPVLKMSKYEYQPLLVIYPHEEREKLKKAKREAAQLALAKAKARKSGNKKSKTKGSSQNSKSKRLTIKRKQRRLPKRRKASIRLITEKNTSDAKSDVISEHVAEAKSEKANVQFESQAWASSSKCLNSGTAVSFQHPASDVGKLDENQTEMAFFNQEQNSPVLNYPLGGIISAPPVTSLSSTSSLEHTKLSQSPVD
ncbi:hypothetical protein EGW08_015649 [Elysia chlorotica]|uniref:Uncharacterized protein n=1 Tax=Elysia chlorotica TaxID=188477 RepID=A0A3S1B028_ELYCH|nr:hypothetical protein EGW08_015649 [Elysia chlorotica]